MKMLACVWLREELRFRREQVHVGVYGGYDSDSCEDPVGVQSDPESD